MGYTVDTWEVDFHVPADKAQAALDAINADPALHRPCYNRAHYPGGSSEPHDCERVKPFDSLTDAVEELTGLHDCEEDEAKGFYLGYHIDKWQSVTDDVLRVLARYADEGAYIRFMGEDSELFGYRVVDGKLHAESATVTWSVP